MLHGQKIIYVSIVDNKSKTIPGFKTRIWHHQKLVNGLLRSKVCIIGRKTFDITRWKGPNCWVLTSDVKWRRSNLGTIHDIDDIHLHTEGDVYVLGGTSLFLQFQNYIDEIHLYVINSTDGKEPWIKLNMRDWKPSSYINRGLWSYGHLIRSKNYDPHELNHDMFDI
jgi:dihydrofolate reductase